MANFQDILNKPMADIKPPPTLPVGTYLCLIDGQPEIVPERGKNKNACVDFPLKFVQFLGQSQAEQEALAAALEGKALQDIKMRHTMWLTDDSAYRLKKFLEDDLQIKARDASEAISQAMGKQVLITLGHRVDSTSSPPRILADIKSTARA